MLTAYIRAAMRQARYEVLSDGTRFGEIPGFQGVWANAATLGACEEELQEVLEEWIVLRLSKHLALPVVDDLTLTVRAEA